MKLVLDSCILVSGLDPNDLFHSECHPIITRLLKNEIQAICPLLVLIETTCSFRRRTNSELLAQQVCHNLIRLPAIDWKEMTQIFAQNASLLGSKTGLRGGDAIILYTAEHYGIPVLTKDREMKNKAPSHISVLEPREV